MPFTSFLFQDMRGVVSLIQKIFQFFSTNTKSKNQNQIENENKNENKSIDDGVKENQNERNRKLRTRIILQLCTAVISKKDLLFDNGASNFLFKKKSFIPKIILNTAKHLFLHLKSVNEIKTIRCSSISEKTYQMKGQNYLDSNGQSKYNSNVNSSISSAWVFHSYIFKK